MGDAEGAPGAQLHTWGEVTAGASGWAVPGRMKGSRCPGPFEGAPSHPGGQLETMCGSLKPLMKALVASVYLSLYFQQLECVSCWEKNANHFNVKLNRFGPSYTHSINTSVFSGKLQRFLPALFTCAPVPTLGPPSGNANTRDWRDLPCRDEPGQAPLLHPVQLFTTVSLVEILWPKKKKTTGHLCVFINGLLAFPKPQLDQGDPGVEGGGD